MELEDILNFGVESSPLWILKFVHPGLDPASASVQTKEATRLSATKTTYKAYFSTFSYTEKKMDFDFNIEMKVDNINAC